MAAVMAHSMGKRKRETQDLPDIRPAPGLGPDSTDFTQQYINDDATEHTVDFAAVLAQHEPAGHDAHLHQRHQALVKAGQSASDTATAALAQYHTMTVPQPTEQSFLNQTTENGDRPSDVGHDQGPGTMRSSSFAGDVDFGTQPANGDSPTDMPQQGGQSKPTVGSDEWHKVRRDNHKEVERRRRETINEGINELAKIVPGSEKNKGSILARAVQFITQLKENETQNIEKWTLEKLLTEQAIQELSSSCDKLKAECQRAWSECEQWKEAAQKAGITIEADNKPVGADNTG